MWIIVVNFYVWKLRECECYLDMFKMCLRLSRVDVFVFIYYFGELICYLLKIIFGGFLKLDILLYIIWFWRKSWNIVKY